MLWIDRFLGEKVVPFVGVLGVVIKFFRAISVANIAPVFRADAVIVSAVCGDGGLGPRSVRVVELGSK